MPELNDPIAPELLDPKPFASLAGDVADDDGPATDEYFEAMDVAPIEYGALLEKTDPSLPRTNRLLTSLAVGGNPAAGTQADPVMLFPPDPNRTHLRIQAYASNFSNPHFMVGSSKSDVYTLAACRFKTDTTSMLVLDGYTGAVWVYSTFADNVFINGMVVTS